MEWPKKSFWLKAGVSLAVITMFGVGFQSRFRIGIDPQSTLSMIDRVFLIDIKDKHIERGQNYVFAVRTNFPIYKDGTELVKRVVGMPGDLVSIDVNYNIKVNGVLVGKGLWHLKELDQNIVRLRFVGARRLDTDEYWVMGYSEKSFDSRYFGAISADQIRGKAYGLF